MRSASLPAIPSGLSVRKCGTPGSASGQTACPVRPTLHQSQSRHSNASPLHSGAHLCPSCRLVWMYVSFLSTWCRTSLPFYFLSVLVVRGGAVCLPTPPSWLSLKIDTWCFLASPFIYLFWPWLVWLSGLSAGL